MRPLSSAALVCVALLVPSSAAAQSNDPESGSPSGTVYEIPLDQGRGDAAPGGPGRRAGGGGGGGGASSPIHSDNGFGSSSTVPGADAAPTGGVEAAQGSGATGTGQGSTTPDEPGKGDDGTPAAGDGAGRDGSGPAARKEPGESDIAAGAPMTGPSTVVSRTAAKTSAAVPRAELILGLGLLVAIGLAAAARLAIRRR